MATSIDVLVVGLGLTVLGAEIVYPSLVLGVEIFFLSIAGFYLGRMIGILSVLVLWGSVLGFWLATYHSTW